MATVLRFSPCRQLFVATPAVIFSEFKVAKQQLQSNIDYELKFLPSATNYLTK